MMDDTLVQLALVLVRLGALTFGTVGTVLGEMERELVGHGWLTHAQFVEAYSLSQLAPGPAGTLIVVPLGYQIAGLAGALVAAVAFYSPTALFAFGAMSLWGRVRENRWPRAIRQAVTPVAIGLLAGAVYTLGQSTIRGPSGLLLVTVATLVLLRTRVPAPVVVLGCAAVGMVFFRP
jgi:chromate transporter